MEELILSLLMWLGSNTAYSIPQELPKIDYRSQEALQTMRRGAEAQESQLEVRALYDPLSRTIFLRNDFNPDSKEDQAYLLHELVHFLQFENRRSFVCIAESEPEAYDLMRKWMKEEGLPDTFDEGFLFIVGLCRTP
jgi:hypothetical protein